MVTNVNGNSVYYKVEIVEEIGPKDIDEMLSSEFDLTLFTCTPGGKTRVTVRSNKVEM